MNTILKELKEAISFQMYMHFPEHLVYLQVNHFSVTSFPCLDLDVCLWISPG